MGTAIAKKLVTKYAKQSHILKCEASLGMSNLDQSIDDGLKKFLKKGTHYAQHSTWNFCGYVWYDKISKQFCEEVWVYGCHIETMAAGTIEELMKNVNSQYGSE